jgi:predicted ester cyclase
MSEEQNRASFRAIPEKVFNTGDIALLDDLVAEDDIEHIPALPGFPTGREGLKQFVQLFRVAFPDLRYTLPAETICEGEYASGYATATGTNTGPLPSPFGPIPATGKQATWMEIHIGRYSGGKLVEHWAVIDQLSMLAQLGLVPAPGQ